MITSNANQQIKSIRKLRDRRYRQETGLFFVEGIRIVHDAISKPGNVQKIIYSHELSRSENITEILVSAGKSNIEIMEVSGEVFKNISTKDGPQGLGAVVRQVWEPLLPETDLPGWWTVLVEVADPGNLGTILRTSDATGSSGVILVGNCTDPFDPTAVRASMGSLFSQRIFKSEKQSFLDWAMINKHRIIGTSDHAKTDYKEITYSPQTILLMGSERQGIPEDMYTVCQEIVSIPMSGIADSLNLAVATSVMMYERFEHQRKRIRNDRID